MNLCPQDIPVRRAIALPSSVRARRRCLQLLLLALAASTPIGAAAQSTPPRSSPGCQLAPADSSFPVTPPRPRVEQMPPDRPNRPRGTFSITVRVTEEGLVDTSAVVISPPMPGRYEVAFKRSLLKARFYPARRKDCAVPATFRYNLEFQ